MTTVNVGAGGVRTINQSETDDVAFAGLGTLNVSGTPTSPINVTLSSVAGAGALDTINITDANVTLSGPASVNALTTYNVGDGGTLTLASGAQVQAGSVIHFTSPNSHLVLGNGSSVSALSGVSGYQPGDTIDFPPTATSVTYADNPGANTGGVLTAMDANGNPIGSIALLDGDYTTQDFPVSPNGSNSTVVGSGGAGGTGNDGTSAAGGTVPPLYRFFDSRTGTQFLTANAGERAALVDPSSPSYRPDLKPETNNFGAVDPASNDPAKIQVFRFFDTNFGTHFFTSSQTEATGLSTPTSATYRSDLVAEPTATFLEDSSQQIGDVAVYRLFDTVHGTHFYTGSTAELAGLTTAGSSTYRPDLVNEGVSFYAPSGSFS